MKRCFLVCGPESSGNRMLAAVLVRAGCAGDGATWQKPLGDWPQQEENAVVIKNNLELADYAVLEGRGYHVVTLIAVRHPVATIGSMLRWGHEERREDAVERMRRTLKKCVENAKGEWWAVPYASLCGQDSARACAALCKLLRLPRPTTETVVVEGVERGLDNQNPRYW